MTAALIKGLALGLMLSISVGPVIFSIIKQSINNGHKGGYFFIAGVSASDISLILVCNLFTQLFQSAMSHEKVIGIAGSIFLIAMGIYNFFFKKIALTEEAKVKNKIFRKRDLAGIFFSGYLMNLLNPGVFLFWFAASATILADSKTELHPIQYRIIVFSVCVVFNLFCDILKVLLAGKIRPRLTLHNIHIINRISGLILIGFGVALIWGLVFHSDKLIH
jgi:threonine/homoserine/homoserine lactone efflux protein